MNAQTLTLETADFAAIKGRQQAAWGSGDYAIVGTTLQIVGEMLCEAVDLRSGRLVLDVAAGNGNATLAAARRFAEVVSTDYVGALLERGRERAMADRLPVVFREADAEALPFADASFDVVLSTFGVMFTPNQQQAADEMMRVCRPGGKIGLANWTPESFIGQLFKTIGKHLPPPPAGVASPALWGTRAHLDKMFDANGSVAAQSRNFVFRYESPEHWLEIFRNYYGPMVKAFEALDATAGAALETDINALIGKFNIAKDGTLVIPSEYLEVVVTRNK
jgi:ubiquinone/menaquinone biosynthesis C-methylase UbiE